MNCSIIVASHNGANLIWRLLDSLEKLDYSDTDHVELVFVDSASEDNTSQIVENWDLPFPKTVLRLTVAGHSFALNRGIEKARGKLLLFTDDDCSVGSQWLNAFVRAAKSYPNGKYFFGRIIPKYDTNPTEWSSIMPRSLSGRDQGAKYIVYREYSRDAYPIGCNMAFNLSDCSEKFYYDERLGPRPQSRLPFGADTELGQRLIRQGGQGVWVPGAIVNHYVFAPRMSWDYAKQRSLADGRCRIYYWCRPGKWRMLDGIRQGIILMMRGGVEVFHGWMRNNDVLKRKGVLRVHKGIGCLEEAIGQLLRL